MGRIVGIDLGTTYSAVAIPEERHEEGFLVVPSCPGCSIILDRFRRRITPSVVAEDDTGRLLVGYPAKGRAGLSPEPIMFAKRWMGEDKKFSLRHHGELAPEDVSAHVLRYLKELAESRLKEPVEEAVITVPAYFSLRAKQMTEKAGALAGLKVSQIVQEPVAAALMFCTADTRDPLRIMTYDLGGGTFDVAILEKRDGVISTKSILAFDGDRFLGGYDFDKLLALWIMDQLNAQGYDLRLEDRPDDKIAFAKLMCYAEQAKIALSKTDHCEIQEPVTGITDRQGTAVAIQLEVSRDLFEDAIRTQVEHTIQLCHRARSEKAQPPIDRNAFDEIILVGGSSRIPLVARRLEEEFGRKPRLAEPDLCVALGAAILAGTRPKTLGCLALDPIADQTDLNTLTVTGHVLPPQGAGQSPAEVTLRALDGSTQARKKARPDGGFVFQNVPLAAGTTTDFVLTVTAADGKELANHRFSVKQEASATGKVMEMPTNVLAKPIAIELLRGTYVVAPERTPLPYQAPVVLAQTSDASGTIRVPILEDDAPLGEILMEGIPNHLAVGSPVEITLTIEQNYQIHARAYVPALRRDQPVVIELPVPRTPTVYELKVRFRDLDRRAQDVQTSAAPATRFAKAALFRQLGDRLQDAGVMLDSRAPDGAQINDCLNQVDALIRSLTAGWKPQPERAVFDDGCEKGEELLARLVRLKPKAAQDGYDRRLVAIKDEAEKAFRAENSAAWAESCRKLEQVCDELERQIEAAQDTGCRPCDPAPPSPTSLLLMLEERLTDLAQKAKRNGRYAGLEPEFREAAASLRKINAQASDSMAQIEDWFQTRFKPLQQRVESDEDTSRDRGKVTVKGPPPGRPG